MTWVVPLALGGLAFLLMAVFTVVSARRRHRAIHAPAGTVGPRVLIHDINDDRCTGCDACVAVCPTNVLDLVENKSRVLRFQDCIQCEACMFACPTEALVMFPEGGVPPPLKVPELDESFQTAIPGQYLIGEVAGKPLVKSAANLGRAVVEHMLATGMQPGALGGGDGIVDVAIVGSGPGGLSAALTCIRQRLSYVVLEKEQLIASTIARYPKGKLVMAEPYDTQNLSLLPVFDSAKEQLIPIWSELIDRVGVQIRRGESVETVVRAKDGAFHVRSTVASYRAQRVVLSIGTRGKPRTLQVPGENLPKIFNLLEDPDEWRGRAVLVVGGGDSACEAALALADAGAKVMISYRGKGFNRAQPKNKQTIESYAQQGRVKAKLGSQVMSFEPETVTIALGDGSQKRYPNDAAFVLIGADPPVQWLEKMGIRFIERPHQYQLGKTDDLVRRFALGAVECPEDAARAAAQVLGGSVGIEPPVAAAAAVSLPMPMGEPVSGPRKWLRSATSIFSSRSGNSVMAPPPPPRSDGRDARDRPPQRAKKFDAPVPLSEFAKRGKTSHSGHGRRDALSAGERTRILRMLRDEGGRLADEDSQVYIGAAPGGNEYDFDFDDSPAPPVSPVPAPPVLRDIPAKPAVVVGLAQAQAARSAQKRMSERVAAPRVTAQQAAPPPPSQPPVPQPPQLPPPLPPGPRSRQMHAVPPRTSAAMSSVSPSAVANMAPAVPPPRKTSQVTFGDEPTRQVDDELLAALRNAPSAKPSPAPAWSKPKLPPPSTIRPAAPDEPTRMASIEGFGDGPTRRDRVEAPPVPDAPDDELEDMTRPAEDFQARFLPVAPSTEPGVGSFEDHRDLDESTRLASLDSIAAMERARNHGPSHDERTRAVNIRNDPSISDIDWDLD
ncbi:MAG: 4Fe-4S dicluster domain-containing protein [Deltaproteobacteria bacterium]|nr:MAG: 4Fe-4S dicluster domain-containing protein [Deltaproteobacteria bacterium]